MKKSYLILLLFLFCLTLIPSYNIADTGTYRILNYNVKLTPRSDGTVEIDYYQKWLVTGGHIPWITVGTPNSEFQINQNKNQGAIKNIKNESSGSWSGVRIDLNKDYKPNETFEVYFTIIQKKLFYADEENYKLDFTPGWYDRAETETLRLEVSFFAKVSTVTTNPKPTKVVEQSMIWEKSKLRAGEKFSISASFPKKVFPKEIAEKELRSTGISGFGIFLIILLVAIVIIIFIGVGVASSSGGGFSVDEDDDHERRPYSGGRILYSGSRGGGSISPRSTGGGGGFGGRSVSCACACVACACACACAGGGAAGCDRKIQHTCPACKDCSNEDCPLNIGLEKGG